MEFGLKPYNFEPEYTEEELVELATASDENSGNDDSSQQTCRCTHCLICCVSLVSTRKEAR